MSDELKPRGNLNLAVLDVKDVAMANYCLNLLAPFNGLSGLVAGILAHLKRSDADATNLEGHYTYQIRTFWIGFIAAIFSVPLIFLFGLGLLTLALTAIWWMLRNAIGLKYLLDGKDIPDPETLLI